MLLGGEAEGCAGRAFRLGVLEVGAFWGGLGLLVASYRVGGVGGAVLKPKEPPERACEACVSKC